jgi:hypothetical protein
VESGLGLRAPEYSCRRRSAPIPSRLSSACHVTLASDLEVARFRKSLPLAASRSFLSTSLAVERPRSVPSKWFFTTSPPPRTTRPLEMTPMMPLAIPNPQTPKGQVVLPRYTFPSIRCSSYLANYPHRRKSKNGSPVVKNTWMNSLVWRASFKIWRRIPASRARLRPCTAVRSVSVERLCVERAFLCDINAFPSIPSRSFAALSPYLTR